VNVRKEGEKDQVIGLIKKRFIKAYKKRKKDEIQE
jgi:hypothetical protein